MPILTDPRLPTPDPSMNSYSRPNPKIDPSRGLGVRPDGSPDDNDRVEIGPTALAFSEWEALNITAPNLERMRSARLDRLCAEIRKRDLGGVLLFDPLNIRYANDSSNMQLWTAHNPSRACFVAPDGYMVLWDFHGCDHLSAYLPLIDEVRHGAGFFYFLADQVKDLMNKHSGGNTRLAIDKIEVAGAHAIEALGIEIKSGQEVLEHSRLIKGVDEINALRCAVATTEITCDAMHAALQPGMTEVELWSIMHAENIKRGGEWIETRILSSGPRTNPWMQEAGPRVIQDGELLAFDTDLIGPYGMCADLSRTWLVGDGNGSAEQKNLYQFAHEHILTNRELLRPWTQTKTRVRRSALRRDDAWRRAL